MPAENIGSEIRQLQSRGPSKGPQRNQRMPHRQAVAVALNLARAGRFGKREQARVERRSATR